MKSEKKLMKTTAQRLIGDNSFDQKPMNDDAEGCERLHRLLERAIDQRHRVLHREADILLNDMEVAIHRIEKHGQNASLGDIKVATWHQTSTEVKILKRTLRALESIMAGAEVDESLVLIGRPSADDDNLQ